MADVQLLAPGTAAAPLAYVVPGAQEIVIVALAASFDGSAAAASWQPAVTVIAPSGKEVGTYPCGTVLAAGASADVAWFPGVGGAGAGGGGESEWCLIGTGTQANLSTGSTSAAIQTINTNASGIFSAVSPSLVTTFHDVNDDPFNQDRWSASVFQIRNAALDAVHADAWSIPAANPITSSLTVADTGELVYALMLKDYIRGLTSTAPFTLLYSNQVPSCVGCGQIFAARAGGQGAGAVTWSGTLPAGDLADPKQFEAIMVGLAGSGGTPTQIALVTTTADATPTVTPVLPGGVQADDVLLLQLAVRQANAIRSIATPSGWTLLASSPTRDVDPDCGNLDQLVYIASGAVATFALEISLEGIYELYSGFQGDDAAAAGAIETALSVTAGGTLATWDGGNYIGDDITNGTLKHWRANQHKLLAVDTAPVQVTLTINNRTGSTIGAWEAGIFARRLSDPLTVSTWDI